MPLRASDPPAWAWLLQRFQHRCSAWRSPPGNPRTAALWGLAEKAVEVFLAFLQVHPQPSPITPMQARVHVSPAHPKVRGKPLYQVRARARAARSRRAGAGESSQRRVRAAPPASGLCRACGEPGLTPAPPPAPGTPPGGRARVLGRRVRAGDGSAQSSLQRSGVQAGLAWGPDLSRLRTPPLSRVVPRGGYWSVRKDPTGPGRAGARTRRREVSGAERATAGGEREGAVFLAKDSDRQEPKQNKTKREKEKKTCRVEPRG